MNKICATVENNATDEEIAQALLAACATEFVEKLPAGTSHQLTQGATNLSGGQKQRLAMARAFVRRPSILVLDDVTSAVDSISEKKFNRRFKHSLQMQQNLSYLLKFLLFVMLIKF